MDKDELKERVAECLRSLDVGESMSVEDVAEAIGEPLSDVNMAVDAMLTERLVFQDGLIGRRTYSLTNKGKHYGTAVTRPKDEQPEVKDESPEAPSEGDEALALSHKEKGYEELTKNEAECTCQYCGTILSSPGRKRNHEPVCGKNPNRNEGCGKKERKAVERMAKMKEAVARKYAGEPRPKDTTELPADTPEADDPRKCRWCGKRLCDKKYRLKHEEKCLKNAKPAKKKGINIPQPALPKKLGNVPAPSEYAGGESPKELLEDICDDSYGGQKHEPATKDRPAEAPESHEYLPDLPSFAPNKLLCHRCEHSVSELVDDDSGALHYDCAANCRTEAECKARHKFVQRPPLGDPVPAPSDYVPDADDGAYHATPTNPLSATTAEERERLESAPAKTPMATAAEVAEAERILQDLRDNDPDRPDEITAARQDERISMTASPGTCAVLRLLSACQMAVNDGADIMLEAHVTLSKGYTVHIHLDAPTAVKEAPPCLN